MSYCVCHRITYSNRQSWRWHGVGLDLRVNVQPFDICLTIWMGMFSLAASYQCVLNSCCASWSALIAFLTVLINPSTSSYVVHMASYFCEENWYIWHIPVMTFRCRIQLGESNCVLQRNSSASEPVKIISSFASSVILGGGGFFNSFFFVPQTWH